MVLRMARPTRRKGSSLLQFRQRIPADVRRKAVWSSLVVPVGSEEAVVRIGPTTEVVQFSLRTRDPSEAKAREAVALSHLEAHWRSLREGPRTLTQKQIVALAGEVYRDIVASSEDNPGEPEGWAFIHRLVTTPFVGSGLQIGQPTRPSTGLATRIGPVDRVLARHALVVDAETQVKLETHVRDAMARASLRLKTNAEGDYSEDKDALRYPRLDIGRPDKSPQKATGQTLTGLVEDWWTEAKAARRSRKTYQSYESTVRHFVKMLGHDVAGDVTRSDVVRFKDERLAQGVSPKTVKGNNLVGLRTVFRWGVSNGRVPFDPTEGVTVVSQRSVTNRSKTFSEAEAEAILTHADRHQQGREQDTTFAAKIWIPWLCAFSGARVGEMAQLRKQDVYQVDGQWIMRITPEAGDVKDAEYREVPLHPQVIGKGFLRFVESAKRPYLFLKPNAAGEIHGVRSALINRLGEFVREVVPDRGVAPNHGWRHTFKTRARGAGVAPETIDAICGHAPANVGASYGETPVAAKARAINSLPDFNIPEAK